MDEWRERAALVAVRDRPPFPARAGGWLLSEFPRIFFFTVFFTSTLISSGPLSVLLHMLHAVRPEYRPVINLWVAAVSGATAAGLLLPRILRAFNPEPRAADILSRADAIAFLSKAAMGVSWAALLAWAAYHNAWQTELYDDYIMAAALAIALLSFYITVANSFLSALFGGIDPAASAARYAYFSLLFPAMTLFIACWFSPLGPMSYNLGHRYWTLRPCRRASINSKTTRGPEFSARKPAGVVRIAVMGDSSSFGLWHRYEDTFAYHLGTMLNAGAEKGVKYEILNAGVPTHRVKSVATRYQQAVRPYAPDMIFIYAGHNDSRADPKRFSKTLAPVLDESRRLGRPVLIATYPHLNCTKGMHALADETRRMSREQGLYLLDLEYVLNHESKYFCPNGIHPNRAGHRLVARRAFAIFKKMEEENMPRR